ncbi:MAG: cyclic nucleotide-binding domain-containing protein, partial [Pseudomonadota bacterium]
MLASLDRQALPKAPMYGRTSGADCGLPACQTGGCTPMKCPLLQDAGSVRLFAKGDVIYWDGDLNDRVYIVLSGVVRGSKLLSDGRRQVCRFAFPGDVVDYARGDEVGFTAEAIMPVRVLSMTRASVEGSISQSACLSALMMRVVLGELDAARNHLLMLGRLSAAERVHAFLKVVEERMGADENGAFKVPMSRQDMADYLGLTIETVSRVVSQMK